MSYLPCLKRLIYLSLNELVSNLWCKLVYAYNKDLNQCVSLQSDQSFSFLSEELLDTWLPRSDHQRLLGSAVAQW